jgi:hypothetical protein
VDGFVVVMDWETLVETVASLLCHLTLLPLNCPALQHGGCSPTCCWAAEGCSAQGKIDVR